MRYYYQQSPGFPTDVKSWDVTISEQKRFGRYLEVTQYEKIQAHIMRKIDQF